MASNPVTIAAGTHAKKYSPSALKNIFLCNAFQSQSTAGKYAAEGTAAHEVAQACLERGIEAYELIGTVYEIEDHFMTVDAEMARHVQVGYVENVLARADGNPILVEQKLPLIEITGEDAYGTADAVILHDKSITVCDLKYGMGVKVDAKDNEQLMTYALSALKTYGHRIGGVEFVDMVIIQPRLNHVSEWRVSVEDLEAFGVRLAILIDQIEHGNVKVVPGETQCRWCEKAGTCEALANATIESVGADFDDLTEAPEVSEFDNATLAKRLASVDMVKAWVKAVEEEARKRMLAGQTLPGHKLVEGRRGTRKWVDETDVEATMRAMRLKQDLMYERSMVSPTSLEKLFKRGVIGPRQWDKLKGLVTQSEGSPTIVTESDPRPALAIDPTAGLFADNT
jgi:hypothetical protein